MLCAKKMPDPKKLIREYGLLKCTLMAIDHFCYLIIRSFRSRLYRWKKDDFGLREAIFWSKDLDPFLRYSKILAELKSRISNSDAKINILEVGAGGEGLAGFLKYMRKHESFNILLADSNPDFLAKVKLAKTIVLNCEQLPFENEEFDIVISVDTLEHIPKDKRENFLKELKRVSKNTVLLHFVMHDPVKQFLGRDGDIKFNQWYLNNFKKEHRWTAEHLTIEPPSCREIENVFENPVITGTQNIDAWFNYITMKSKPVVGLLTGFFFLYKWKNKINLPPYHGCFVKWSKSQS